VSTGAGAASAGSATPSPSPALLELRDLTKRFGSFVAVDALSLTVSGGEFLTILGASGSGKTTTLRLIAGFERATSGAILMDGVDLASRPPFKRPVNTVFQQYALFPHMTVRENVAYGLVMQQVPHGEIGPRVQQALEMVQLADLAARRPRQLSGGQQQRVALARALVNRPRVLLLDEPLGALDLKLRRQMQLELKQLQTQLGITFIYVTHDQEEALTMSDRIALMRAGTIEQLGSPRDMYERPRTRYVADFIGETNLLRGAVVGERGGVVALRVGESTLRAATGDVSTRLAGQDAWLSVRPESVTLTTDPTGARVNVLSGVVVECVYVGSLLKVYVELDDRNRLIAQQLPGAATLHPGERVWASWPVERGTLVAS
jgi:spermidine/putrescine transport system ATP-binding protein